MSPRPSRGYQTAIDLPSGDQTGLFWKRVAPVSERMAPLPTSTTQTLTESRRPLIGAGTRANAICFPSGDHARWDGALPGGSENSSDHAPLVRRFASPSSGWIQMCCGGSSFRRNRSWSPTWNVPTNFATPSNYDSV
jgi:hypothetical protein